VRLQRRPGFPNVVVSAATQTTTTASKRPNILSITYRWVKHRFRYETASVPGPLKYAPVTLAFEIFSNRRDQMVAPGFICRSWTKTKGCDDSFRLGETDQVVTNVDTPALKITIPRSHHGHLSQAERPRQLSPSSTIPVFRSPNCLGAGVTPGATSTRPNPKNTKPESAGADRVSQ